MDILFTFQQVMGAGEKTVPFLMAFGMDVEVPVPCNKKDAGK